jgi:hypothetical protein
MEHKTIGEILVDLKLLRPRDIDRILDALAKRQRRQKFGQMARDMGLVEEEHILAALAVQMGLFPGIQRLSINQILEQLQVELPA